jgi:TRAP-type mannitol/chloroaromatic compound transport system substrate-binding protein
MPDFACFDAASQGTIEAYMGSGQYWHDKEPAPYYYAPGWHEPGTTNEFGFNRKAYEALPVDLRRTLDHAAATQRYGLADFHAKNALALERLRAESKGKVEILRLPAPVLRDLKKLAADVTREQSEKSPMARKVHASFTRFQALVGSWDHVAEGAYHQFVAM